VISIQTGSGHCLGGLRSVSTYLCCTDKKGNVSSALRGAVKNGASSSLSLSGF
jgi:hypothetical protein